MFLQKLLILALIFIIVASEESKKRGSEKLADECVESALRILYYDLTGKHGDAGRFIEAMYPSRRLYGALFAGNFTRDEFESFCKYARMKAYDISSTSLFGHASESTRLRDRGSTSVQRLRIETWSRMVSD